MGISHRFPALSIALLTSFALSLTTLAGTSCDFVEVNAKSDMLLWSEFNVEMNVRSASIGILCNDGFFEEGGDQMWKLSRIFLLIALGFGATTSAIAWAISLFIPPTNTNWKFLSFLCSLTAVIQVPIFLLFETEPCSQFKERQKCTLGIGSYFVVASTLFWVSVTLITQCLDPPLWATELSAWRVGKEEERRAETGYEMGEDEFQTTRIASPPQHSFNNTEQSQGGWFARRAGTNAFVRKAPYSESSDNEQLLPVNYTDGSIDSRLVLRVLPDGKIPGDEGKSAASFEDLDSIVRLVEEGKLLDAEVQPNIRSALRVKSLLDDAPSSPVKEKVTIAAAESPGEKTVSLNTSYSSNSPGKVKVAEAKPMTGESILADLESQGRTPSDPTTSDSYLNGSPNATPAKKSPSVIPKFTKKGKREKRRRKSGRRQRSRGYIQMLDDDLSDSTPPFISPPIEVKIKLDNLRKVNDIAPKVSDDEQEQLMDEWEALHAATNAGARMGLQEGDDPFESDSISSYHSDPEPVIYSSDESESEVSIPKSGKTPPDMFGDAGDNSTLSSSSASSPSKNRSTRSRSSRNGRFRKRRHSPSASLKSGGSLLGTTIDEETEQDVIEESSAGEEDLVSSYALRRAASDPETRGRSSGIRASRRVRRSMSQSVSSPKDENIKFFKEGHKDPQLQNAPDVDEELGITKVGISTEVSGYNDDVQLSKDGFEDSPLNGSFNEDDEPAITIGSVSTKDSGYDDGYSLTADENESESSLEEASLRSDPISPLATRRVDWRSKSRSLSPSKNRRLTPMKWRDDAKSVGAIHARRVAVVDDDSSGNSTQRSKRAREFRIRRLQSQTGSKEGLAITTRLAMTTPLLSEPQEKTEVNVTVSPQTSKDGMNEDNMTSIDTEADDDLPADAKGVNDEVNITTQLAITPPLLMNPPEEREVNVTVSPQTSKDGMNNDDVTSVHTEADDALPVVAKSAIGEDNLNAIDTTEDDDLLVHTEGAIQSLIESEAPRPRVTPVVSDEETDYTYVSSTIDDLDLQLIEVRRPIGSEYGEDEVSL